MKIVLNNNQLATKQLLFFAVISFLIATGLAVLVTTTPASALSGSDFKAGHIIDDAVFNDDNSMTVSQIQNFLNSKVPSCDTDGEKMYTSTKTRAEWAAESDSRQDPPYTCLKEFTQNIGGVTNGGSDLCTGSISSGKKKSAQIIHDVAKACGVNPQVLIVMLQKEQSLVTDDWPWQIQYDRAMGYACPDSGENFSANCDESYYGFFNQVYNAAKAFRRYEANPDWYNYKPNRDNTILYNPDPDCGSSTVFINNQATANLYIYTPYQPNNGSIKHAIDGGPYVPTSYPDCGAYGNINFWGMFNNWFGSTLNKNAYAWSFVEQKAYLKPDMTQAFTKTSLNLKPGQKVYLRIKARNKGYKTWDQSFIRLGTSGPQDRQSKFFDESWDESTRPTSLLETSVAPGDIGTFEFAITAPDTLGSYKEYFNVVAEAREWMYDIGQHYPINVTTAANPVETNHTLTPGTEIKPNERLLSQDAHNNLLLQNNGNLVLYSTFKPVWSTGTEGTSTSRLIMQDDGNLVLYNTSGEPLWNSGTHGNSGARLVLQTDGNMVIYSESNVPLWSTRTNEKPGLLMFANPTLKSSKLYTGQRLDTVDRRYRLALQGDGNLVIYSQGKPKWASDTVGKKISHLSMQRDGNLVLYNEDGGAVWHTKTNGQGVSRLEMQPDGNLVIYNKANKPTWHTKTYESE